MSTLTSFDSVETVTPFPMRRFTVDEYHRLGAAGVLADDARVELLEGCIVTKMIHNPQHDGTIGLVDRIVRPFLPHGWIIRVQSAITTVDSEPEPDFVIVRGREETYTKWHPGPADIGVLVEVADASLSRDRAKCRLYGRAGVPVYWIVNLVERQIEVFRDPTGPVDQPGYQCQDEYPLDRNVPLLIDELATFKVGLCQEAMRCFVRRREPCAKTVPSTSNATVDGSGTAAVDARGPFS